MKDAWPKHSDIVNENGRGEIQRGMGIILGWRSWSWRLFLIFVIIVVAIFGDAPDDAPDDASLMMPLR